MLTRADYAIYYGCGRSRPAGANLREDTMLHTLTNCEVVLWEEREGDGGFYVVIAGDRRSDGARVEYSADIIYDRISVRPEDEGFACDVDAGDDH